MAEVIRNEKKETEEEKRKRGKIRKYLRLNLLAKTYLELS